MWRWRDSWNFSKCKRTCKIPTTTGTRTKPLANADFFSSVIPAVVTSVCSAAAYTAASVVTYDYIDQKELEKIFSSSFLPPDLYGYPIKIYKYST